jgi:hypothetical protein
MGREYSTNGEKRNVYRILVGKPEGKRPVGRPRRRWVDPSGSIKCWEIPNNCLLFKKDLTPRS